MKNYLVFIGQLYYPEIGMGDFVQDCETLKEAIRIIQEKKKEWKIKDWSYHYASVYSIKSRKEVYKK